MTKWSILFTNNRFSFVLGLFCIFFFVQYLRKRKLTLLCLAVGSFVYIILSFTIFFGHKGYNLISLSTLGILVVIGSYKELMQLEKEGKTVAHLLNFDFYDYIFAIALLMAWLLIKNLLLY